MKIICNQCHIERDIKKDFYYREGKRVKICKFCHRKRIKRNRISGPRVKKDLNKIKANLENKDYMNSAISWLAGNIVKTNDNL